MQERVKPKKKVTLSIDPALASSAAADGLDLASILEQALQDRAKGHRAGALTPAELKGLEALDRYVAEHGDWWNDEDDQPKAS